MRRRDFVATVAGTAFAQSPGFASILVHEHVLVDFRGADQPQPGPYDPEEVFRIAKPHLDAIHKLGCRRFQDATPNYLGRSPKLLRRLQDATGIEIWTNTGLYSARMHKYLPPYVKTDTPGQIARRWVEEWRNGVDGMKPRFIKIGVNRGPLDELDRKIVRAAAIASKETGLTFASHTGNGAAALEQVAIVAEETGDPAKFVWVHAYNEKDHAIHEKVARAGAWVQFDGIGPKSAAWHVECVQFMESKGLLGRTLVSQDAGYYRVGEPGGGAFRDYASIYRDFLPKISPGAARTLLVDNAIKAYGGVALSGKA